MKSCHFSEISHASDRKPKPPELPLKPPNHPAKWQQKWQLELPRLGLGNEFSRYVYKDRLIRAAEPRL